MDEILLSRLLRTRDRDAFDYLYDQYSPLVYGEIMRIVQDDEIAGDVLHDVFVTIWHTCSQFDPSEKRLFTWLIAIARKKCTERLHYTS
jgi:RNA polymerase sigma factor (sigma-70 family)